MAGRSTESLAVPQMFEKTLGIIVFVVVVAVFFFDTVKGWKAVGVVTVIGGLWSIWARRIPYGMEGRPPAVHLTGWVAVLVGVLQIVLGTAIFWAAEYLASGGARGG